MKMSRCFLSPLVAAVFVLALSSQTGPAMAAGKSGKDTVSRVVEINKQALAQLQAIKYEAARDTLWNAIAVLNDANMGDHEIAARTHVHLAAVYMTGFNDRAKAIRQFVMALKIDPNIKITPQVETAALDEAFDAARGQASLAPVTRTAAPAASAGRTPAAPAASSAAPGVEDHAAVPASGPSAGTSAGGRRGGLRGARRLPDQEEPPPPAKVPEPFYCPLPSEVPPKEDILVRCVTQKQPRRASATLFYRESGAEDFTPLPMTRSARGWLEATVPAAAVTGSAFQFYLEAKVPGSKEPLTVGSADSPNLMPIIDGAVPMNNAALVLLLEGKDTSTRAEPIVDDKAPLDDIIKQHQIDEDLRKYHRRYVGSVFFSIGGGLFAMTYHGKAKAAGRFTDPNNSNTVYPPLSVNSGTNPASLFQLVPELGYVVSEKLALSAQVRFQYVPFDSTGLVGGTKPPTIAWAVFPRAQYNFLTLGNFQTFASGAVGIGPRTFLANVSKACDTSNLSGNPPPGCNRGINDHSNIVTAGPVAVAVGIGFLYHLTRWMGFWIEARGMSSVSPIMFLGEANAGFVFAHKFEKAAPPPPKEEGGWEKPPEAAEAPPADAPSSE